MSTLDDFIKSNIDYPRGSLGYEMATLLLQLRNLGYEERAETLVKQHLVQQETRLNEVLTLEDFLRGFPKLPRLAERTDG